MNWGHGVAIATIAFMVFILSFVYKATKTNIDLEYDDYYAKELSFNDVMERSNNTVTDSVNVEFKSSLEGLRINFNGISNIATGNIRLLCLTDALFDLTLNLQSDTSNSIFIPTKTFKKRGQYKILLDWESNGRKYYNENVVSL